MAAYTVELVLRRQGEPAVLATKRARIHMDDLPSSEWHIRLKGMEIIRDAQCIDNPEMDLAKLWRRRRAAA